MALKSGLALFHIIQVKDGVVVDFCFWSKVRELAVPVRRVFCRGEGTYEEEEVPSTL